MTRLERTSLIPSLLATASMFTQRICAAPVNLHIPAGPARSTLWTFIRQTNVDILFNRDEVGSYYTRAVSGRLEPSKALGMMLVGSGLHYRLRPNSAIIHPTKAAKLFRTAADKLRQCQCVSLILPHSSELPVPTPWCDGGGEYFQYSPPCALVKQ